MLAFLAKVGIGGLGLAKRGLKLLGKLNGWQLLCIALFAAMAIFYVQRNNARDERDTARVNLNEARAELRRISTKRDEQSKRTTGNIERADKLKDEAEGRARVVEDAPTPPDCATAPEVMRSDI